jgi:hypothetical protein
MLSCREVLIDIICYNAKRVRMERESEVTIGRTNTTDGRRKPEEIGKKMYVRLYHKPKDYYLNFQHVS